MITPSLIYWITRLDAVRRAAGALCVLSILAVAAGLFALFVCTADDVPDPFRSLWRNVTRVAAVALAVFGLVLVLTPTKREMAAIIVLPKIANSETVAEIGDGVKTLAVEWLEELRPKGDAKKGGAE
jgi:hypothetical protein